MSRGSIVKTSKTSDLSLLSRITYGWAGGFLDLCRAMKEDTDKDHKNISVDNESVSVPVDVDAASQRSDFIAAFERNAGEGQWRKTIFELSRKTFVSDFALQLTSTATMLLVPNLTASLVDWLPLVEKMPWWKPYAMAVLIWSILIVRSLCQNYGITLSAIAACRFSFGLTGAVHQKMTRLSEASKQKFGGGSVANLMAMDPLRFNIVMTVMPHLIIAPFQIVGSIGLLSYYVGWTALAGLVVILLYLPFQYTISKRLDGIRESYSKVADDRLRLTREAFESIRLIKFFGWEETFISRILSVREKELASVKTILTLSAVTLCLAIWLPALGGALIVSLHSWRTLSTGTGKIDPGITYMILSIMTYLIAPVYIIPVFSSVLVAAKVSAKRLDEFFESPERIGLLKESSDGNIIEIKEADFEWESLDKVDEEKPGSRLSNVNLSVPRGSLVVIVGPVASGKSSLLSALLGEMHKTCGEASINLPAEKSHFAYCPQQSWLMAGTVRENVLFGRPFDPQLYSQALMESCLFPDLKSMPNGDATEIGENGAGLSGGQKQRISLARALYSQSQLYLLDDPLSALDATVAHTILNKCIAGGMIKEKTRLLVTHQIGLLVGLPEGSIDILVIMEENRMTYVGPYDSSKLNSPSFSAHSGPVNDVIDDEEAVNASTVMFDQMVADMSKDGKSEPSEGSKLPISTDQNKVVLYLRAAGWTFLVITVCFCLAEASGIARDLYIRASLMVDTVIKPSELRQIILVYIGLCLSQGIFSYIRMIILGRLVSTRVARTTHESVLRSVCSTTFAFFDQTAIGDLASRFGKDMGSVDVNFPEKGLQMLGGFGAIVSTMVLMCIALASSARLSDLIKYLGILFVGLAPVLFALRMCWVRFTSGWPAIQALVGQNTGKLIASSNETLSGLSTITAYNASSMFDQRILRKIEATERSFFLVTVLGRWLNLRVDACSASMVGVTMLLCLFGKIEASLAGLLILYSLNAAYVVAWFVSTMAETQSELFAFDRVMALATKLQSETALASSKLSIVPPSSWPQSGTIKFKDVCVKYRAELPPVLKDVSLSIEPGQKVALVGRTGSGKSSLIAALYRVMEPESGWIEIDGIATTQIPLNTLRHALSIVPQDPVLFAGTLRFNMDPESEHTDEQVWSALRETGMDSEVKDLDARVEEKGTNFSTGQRQLLCLARALLRPTKILVIDEATANVDHETDKRIQTVLREHVKRTGCTLITVAHRISTIIDYDRIAVLDAGSLIEFGTPAELLAIQGGAFKSLADKAHDPSSPH